MNGYGFKRRVETLWRDDKTKKNLLKSLLQKQTIKWKLQNEKAIVSVFAITEKSNNNNIVHCFNVDMIESCLHHTFSFHPTSERVCVCVCVWSRLDGSRIWSICIFPLRSFYVQDRLCDAFLSFYRWYFSLQLIWFCLCCIRPAARHASVWVRVINSRRQSQFGVVWIWQRRRKHRKHWKTERKS